MTIFDQHTTSALHRNNKEKSIFEVGNFKLLKHGQKMKTIKNFQKILKMHKKCYKSRVKSLKSDKNSLFYDQMPNFKKSTVPELDTSETTNTKKVMSNIQNLTFFGQIWAKMTKNAIFGHKNGQKYHFRIGFMIRPLCQI